MIVHLSKIDRLFGLSHRSLLKNNTTNIKIINKVDNFLEKYCYFFNITPKEVASIVNKFQKRYAKDVKRYFDTGKYPHELNVDEFLYMKFVFAWKCFQTCFVLLFLHLYVLLMVQAT